MLSTDAIRAEVFGDAAVQGPWIDIQQHLQQRLIEAVAAGIPVIIDATHARRPWRLALTQGPLLPAPVEWIGWWLYTPLPTCLEWNRHRERQVPEPGHACGPRGGRPGRNPFESCSSLRT